MNDWFVIKDLTEFTDKARAIVYNNFGDWDSEQPMDIMMDNVKESEQSDFDQILSHQESEIIIKQIAKKQRNKKTDQIRYILNEKLFVQVIEDLNARMVSNILNSLVQKGLVESAYDTESNDFVFWVKDEHKDNQQKPETD